MNKLSESFNASFIIPCPTILLCDAAGFAKEHALRRSSRRLLVHCIGMSQSQTRPECLKLGRIWDPNGMRMGRFWDWDM
jgi:hypothetical protein